MPKRFDGIKHMINHLPVAAAYAIIAFALGGLAGRLGTPQLMLAVGQPKAVDWTAVSAVIASIAAALMSVAKVLEQVRSVIDGFRGPTPAPTPAPTPQPPTTLLTCDCGAQYPAGSTNCWRCGKDLRWSGA